MREVVIETERLRLRPLRLADAAVVRHLAGSLDVAATTLNIPHPYEDSMAEQWIERTLATTAAGTHIGLAVALKAEHSGRLAVQVEEVQRANHQSSDTDDRLVGAIGLTINKQNNWAELGYWIGRPYWNNGFGTEAARALVSYGFQKLGLNRIQARHMTKNPASGRIMQKIGMSYEGTLRQAGLRFGRYEDLAVYAILHSEHGGDTDDFK